MNVRKTWLLGLWVARSPDGSAGGGGAPTSGTPAAAAPTAPTPLAAAAAKAAEGAPPAAKTSDGKGAPGAQQPPAGQQAPDGQQPPASYFPQQGIPETLRGATERETLDNIAKELGSRPKAPEKADGYTYSPSDAFKQRYGEAKDDPVLPLWREVAHGLGLDDNQFNKAYSGLYEKMHEAGLIEEPIDLDKELSKLEPASGDPQQKKATASQRVNTAVNWVSGLATRGVLSKEEAAKAMNLAVDATGVQVIEKLMKMGGEHGIQPGGGAPGASGDTKEALISLMSDPRYDLRGPKGDPRFVADVDARWRRMHGAS